MDHLYENQTMPNNEDYIGAVQAIHRLSDTYLIEPDDIRKGNISTNYPSRQLTGIFVRKYSFCYFICF